MSWVAAVPLIGTFFEQIGAAIDRNVTTDAERLKLKGELTQHYVPIVGAVIEAQKNYNDMQVKIAEIEAKSEHWLVWSRRPIIAFISIGNLIAAGIFKHMDIDSALYFAMIVNGLDTGTRGVEKVIKNLKQKEEIK